MTAAILDILTGRPVIRLAHVHQWQPEVGERCWFIDDRTGFAIEREVTVKSGPTRGYYSISYGERQTYASLDELRPINGQVTAL